MLDYFVAALVCEMSMCGNNERENIFFPGHPASQVWWWCSCGGISQGDTRPFWLVSRYTYITTGTFSNIFYAYILTVYYTGLHKFCHPTIRDGNTWSKFGAHGKHGDVFLFSNLGAL